jgi:type I restriction-modification system DNA methylase subunit
MTESERREQARQFIQKWHGKGKEDEDDRSYWLDILQRILGMDNATDRIDFQKKVIVDGNTKKIDAYIPETRVLIEQKSLGVALERKAAQSGGISLTPYEQAKRYNDNLPYDEKARWIIISNFAEIWVYDMNARVPTPQKFSIENMQNHSHFLDFIMEKKDKAPTVEEELSKKAGEYVGRIYDAFIKQYNNPDSAETQKSLNILCVRLVFCLYAEDAGLFSQNDSFSRYIGQYEPKDIRRALIDLFEVLDTPEDSRKAMYLSEELASFPYVNGGLFAIRDKNGIEIPQITEEIKQILLESAKFDWSGISPTIFGAVFESTLNPDTRRKGGMHYTSIENIHKAIDSLFLDELKAELDEIAANAGENATPKQKKDGKNQLLKFQNKLSSLKFLDPACGSGNFLTETYLSLRRLENEVLKLIYGNDRFLGDIFDPIKVHISQFYGIEINDFAVAVAKTALWIAESQMMRETEDIMQKTMDFLPLKTNANIVEGNALRMDWSSVVSPNELNYIMGNPPFVGYSLQNPEQKAEMLSIYRDEKGRSYKTAGKIDYVAAWYWKAAEFMRGLEIKAALVSTNSITQGEQVAAVWKPLYERFGVHIDFAWRTFRWDSESSGKAHVHCVIIGFSCTKNNKQKTIYDGENRIIASNINAYLIDAKNIFVESRKKPLCDVPQITTGNRPADGGHLLIEDSDYEEFLKKEPSAAKWIKRLTGSEEFINGKKRWCLWLKGITPSELRKMPEVLKRVEACKQDRLKGAADRQKLAATPWLFREQINPEIYAIIPRVSSENRRYIPIGYLDGSIIPTDSALIIEECPLYHFGILTSNVHNAWTRAVCGRLEMRYRYSKDIVYNNFPWPECNEKQKAEIEKTAQMILDARKLYPKDTLADLYDPLTMPPELLAAHRANDKTVMQAYGIDIKTTSEPQCVAFLMKRYREMAENN